jgi:hypothetical protein
MAVLAQHANLLLCVYGNHGGAAGVPDDFKIQLCAIGQCQGLDPEADNTAIEY